MASINFSNLKNPNKSSTNYTFVDLNLDMSEETISTRTASWTNVNNQSKDIKVAYDINAIKNSLINLFNTMPGERLLLPDYGSDIRQFIFEPITEATGRSLGYAIKDAIEKWEPRVTVLNLNIVGKPDQNEYDITMIMYIPFLKEKLDLRSILTRNGYIVY